MQILNSLNNIKNTESIGVVFTPLHECKRIILLFNLFEKWLNGKTFFDPTAGEGNFIEAFIDIAVEKNIVITDQMLDRLFANEINKEFIEIFFKKIKKRFNISFPENNFFNKDIILEDLDIKVDILIGNPPWANFNDLPNIYKNQIKSSFIKYDLVKNAKDLLLGGSRIDIAALVVSKTIQNHLVQKGEAYYFLPLSIFLNGDAHRHFRSYSINSINFCVNKIIDYKNVDIFEGAVSTRYGFVVFQRDIKQQFPIDYQITENKININTKASPLYFNDDALTISLSDDNELFKTGDFKITLNEDQKPRQGINTCGRNDIFIFDFYESLNNDLVRVKNKNNEAVLPKKYIFPLLTRSVVSGIEDAPEKWVLLPYNNISGKILDRNELESSLELYRYLELHRQMLISRKGVLIQSGMKKGNWWCLLGVGPYSFAPYKIIWQAYGDKKFTVRLLEGRWQANQSMHAFIPFKSKEHAKDLFVQFQNPFIEKYLLSQRMEGTCNWAQPGKISKLLNITYKQPMLL